MQIIGYTTMLLGAAFVGENALISLIMYSIGFIAFFKCIGVAK